MALPFAGKVRTPPLDGIILSMIVDYGKTNQVFDIPNGCIVSFECKRNARDASNTFTMTLRSDYVIDLEYQILTSNKKVSITYGWVQEHKTLVGCITGCDIKFNEMSMALAISGVISAHEVEDTMKRTCIWQAGTSLDKIITLICNAHGWQKGFIVNSSPIPDDIPQSDMTDSQFLRRMLSGEITTADEKRVSDYCLWFTFDGPTTFLNYAPLEYRKDVAENYVYDLSGTTNSRMTSFELKNQGELAFNVGSSLKVEAIDEDTGELVSVTSDEQRIALAKTSDFKGGRRVVFSNAKSSRVKVSNSKNTNSALNKYWNEMSKQALQAEATFMGDLYLECGSSINVAVILADGRTHYSSGLYTITELTDTIDDNGYTSKASLVKVSSGVGIFTEAKY